MIIVFLEFILFGEDFQFLKSVYCVYLYILSNLMFSIIISSNFFFLLHLEQQLSICWLLKILLQVTEDLSIFKKKTKQFSPL